MPFNDTTPHVSGTSLFAQARNAAGTGAKSHIVKLTGAAGRDSGGACWFPGGIRIGAG